MGLRVAAVLTLYCVSAWLFPFTETLSIGELLSYGTIAVYSRDSVPGKFNSSVSFTADISTRAEATVLYAVAPSDAVHELLQSLDTEEVQDVQVCCWVQSCPNYTQPDSFLKNVAIVSRRVTADTEVRWVSTI